MTRSFRRNLNVYQTLSMLSFSWFLWGRHWVVIQLCDWTHLFKCYLFIITIFIDTRAFTVSAGFSFKLFFFSNHQPFSFGSGGRAPRSEATQDAVRTGNKRSHRYILVSNVNGRVKCCLTSWWQGALFLLCEWEERGQNNVFSLCYYNIWKCW